MAVRLKASKEHNRHPHIAQPSPPFFIFFSPFLHRSTPSDRASSTVGLTAPSTCARATSTTPTRKTKKKNYGDVYDEDDDFDV